MPLDPEYVKRNRKNIKELFTGKKDDDLPNKTKDAVLHGKSREEQDAEDEKKLLDAHANAELRKELDKAAEEEHKKKAGKK